MIYFHYDESTGYFQGWYDDNYHTVIPTPNVEVTTEQHMAYIDLLNRRNKLLQCVDGKIIIKEAVVILTWDDIRSIRNGKLNETDWSQMPDVDAEVSLKYRAFRQALRDITDHFDDPNEVRWPTLEDYGI